MATRLRVGSRLPEPGTHSASMPKPPELKTLDIRSDGDVGTLTLNRPDAMNAMDPELIFELTVAEAWLADRAPFRALVVTGSGRAFSAGGDVNWFMRGLEDPEHDLPADVRRGAEVLRARCGIRFRGDPVHDLRDPCGGGECP